MKRVRADLIVLFAILLLAGVVAVWFVTRPAVAPHPAKPDVIVRVTAEYPGADARTVADTVAHSIEKLVNGVEGQMRLESESRDGTYTMTVRFAPHTDADLAVVMVQNRVNIALPQLPEVVRARGVSVRKAADGPPVVWVAVTSPDGKYDRQHLSNFTRRQVVPSLEKLAGVSEVVVAGGEDRFAEADGVPAVMVGVTPWAGGAKADDVRTALGNVADVPEGVKLAVAADVAAGGVLAIAVQLPDAASAERTQDVVTRARTLVAAMPGVTGTVAYGEPGRANAATMLVKRTADQPTAAEVRMVLDESIREALCRVSEAVAGREPFAGRVAVCDTAGLGEAEVYAAAEQIAERWRADPAVSDVFAYPRPTTPRVRIDIDREKATGLGVSVDDVLKAIDPGGLYVNDFNRFGRDWSARIQTRDDKLTRTDWNAVRVRTKSGELVPLSSLVTVRDTVGPEAVVRIDLYPAVVVSTNADSAKLVKKVEGDLPAGVKMVDLSRPGR